MKNESKIPKYFEQILENIPVVAKKGLLNGIPVFYDADGNDIQEKLNTFMEAEKVKEVSPILLKHGYKITKITKKKEDEALDE